MTDSKPKKEVTVKESLEILKGIKSAWVALTLNTIAKMKKGGRSGVLPITEATGREAEGYRKVSNLVGLIGTAPDYAKLTKGRLAKHDLDHEAWLTSPRKWGKNIDGVEVQHFGKDGMTHHYVIFHAVANNKPKVHFEYAGEQIELTDVEKEYLPKSSESKKQQEAGLSKEEQIVHREVEIVNIVDFTHNGTKYVIKH